MATAGLNAQDTHLSDVTFKEVLSVFCIWFDENKFIDVLKVLYRDFIDVIYLDVLNTTDLLRPLINSDELSRKDLTLLYETIKLTKQFALEKKLNNISYCPNLREINISKFSLHRQKLVMLGHVLRKTDVKKIDNIYNCPVKEYNNSFSMILDLELELKIVEEEMEIFKQKLNRLNLKLALKVLNTDLTKCATVGLRIGKRKKDSTHFEEQPLLKRFLTEFNYLKYVFHNFDTVYFIDNDLDEFIEKLENLKALYNKLQLKLSHVNMGTKKFIMHLFIHEQKSLVDLWERYSSGNLLKELSEIIGIADCKTLNDMRIYISEQEYDAAFIKLKKEDVEFTVTLEKVKENDSKLEHQKCDRHHCLQETSTDFENTTNKINLQYEKNGVRMLLKLFKYFEELGIEIFDVGSGSLIFYFNFYNAEDILELWKLYSIGTLHRHIAKLLIQEIPDFESEWNINVDQKNYELALGKLKRKGEERSMERSPGLKRKSSMERPPGFGERMRIEPKPRRTQDEERSMERLRGFGDRMSIEPKPRRTQGEERSMARTQEKSSADRIVCPNETQEKEFRDFLFKLSKCYEGNKYKQLRFCLYSIVPFGELSNCDNKAIDLFNELTDRGSITVFNINLLADIAEITGLVNARRIVQNYKEENEYVEKESCDETLSVHRRRLFNVLRNVGREELQTVKGNYSYQGDKDNIWDVVIELENQLLLNESNVNRFLVCLTPASQECYKS